MPDGMLMSPIHLQEQVLDNRIRVGTRLTREHARLRGGSDASREGEAGSEGWQEARVCMGPMLCCLDAK